MLHDEVFTVDAYLGNENILKRNTVGKETNKVS
jgi:hypothetical protein